MWIKCWLPSGRMDIGKTFLVLFSQFWHSLGVKGQVGLKLMILVFQFAKCLDYSCVPPHWARKTFLRNSFQYMECSFCSDLEWGERTSLKEKSQIHRGYGERLSITVLLSGNTRDPTIVWEEICGFFFLNLVRRREAMIVMFILIFLEKSH